MWVVIATSCADCGGDSAILLLDREPTKDDEQATRKSLGNMWCIKSKIAKVEIGEIATIKGKS